MRDKYIWLTDTHLDKVTPWTKIRFIKHLIKEKPKGIFITGDISTGTLTILDLKILSTFVKCPIYFVLGNHDYHGSSIEETHNKIKNLCKNNPNLIWLTNSDVIPLNEETCLIGTEGWYDARIGNTSYLRFTFDWFFTKDFRKLPTMDARVEYFRKLADESAYIIQDKLEKALEQGYKTIYLLTHFPPWREATRDEGTLMERFWLPYNVNMAMGKAIEKTMKDRNKRHVTVLCGHTHTDTWIQVTRNIECKVNRSKYYGSLRNEETIFI